MRLFIADGTPEELERASRWLRNLIEDGKSGPAVASRPASPAPDGGALDQAIEAWFNERFPDPEDEHRIRAMQFLTAVWDLGPDVHIQPGRKSGGDQTAKPYLFAKGARGRAFVYFRPLSGVARFDLPPEEAPDRRAVRITRRRGYAVTVTIMDEESLQVAAELARLAYERNTGKRQAA